MAVFSGMLGVTLFGIFLTPVFFYVIDTLSESRFFANPTVRSWAGSCSCLLLPFVLLRQLFQTGAPQGAGQDREIPTRIEESELIEQK